MATLLLRLAGPMQSWGTQSRFSLRDTGREPSKSGVIGLLCAALGRRRDAPLDDLATLRMGVRVDCEGSVKVDFQTAGGVHRRNEKYGVVQASGKPGKTVTSYRYYLAGGDFLVGLEGDEDLLHGIDVALQHPRWQLFLGRKSYLPGEPVRLPDGPFGPGLRAEALELVLRTFPWLPSRYPPWMKQPDRLRLVLDAEPGDPRASEVREDVPLSFAERRFATRYVRTDWVPVPVAVQGGG
jgi:CRISPR system Cascade subunit CasD